MSACRCKSVQWSCLCSANVCVSVHWARGRVCARARVHVPRRGCRRAYPRRERPARCRAAEPLTSPRARGHPPWRAVHRNFFRVYDILEGGAVRTRLPGPTPALLYRTCTPQNRGPQVGPSSQTHKRMRSMVVKGWSKPLIEALGGSVAAAGY